MHDGFWACGCLCRRAWRTGASEPAGALAAQSASEGSSQLTAQALTTGQLTTQAADTNWGLESIFAAEAQAASKSKSDPSKPVCVVVLDTGFYKDNQAFSSNVIETWNMVTGFSGPIYPTSAQTYDNFRTQVKANSVVPPSKPADKINHGTHVAGIVHEVAPDAKLLLVRVADENGDISEWALYNAYVLIRHYASTLNIRVVNFSGGNPTDSLPTIANGLCSQISKALDEERIVTVCSAGNTGTTGYNFPADYDPVVSVMALKRAGSDSYNVSRDLKSNYNASGQKTKDICAPGNSIYSAVGTSGYGYMSGTSMAAPHVAGTLALMFAAYPDLSASDALQRLYDTATDLGDEGWDEKTGYGEVNALAAVNGFKIEGPQVIPVSDKFPGFSPYAFTATSSLSSPTWASSNSEIVHVDNGGRVTGKAPGTAVLTVSDGSTTAKRAITVEKIDLSKLSTDPSSSQGAYKGYAIGLYYTGATYPGSAVVPADYSVCILPKGSKCRRLYQAAIGQRDPC